jgi:hypothetical protein
MARIKSELEKYVSISEKDYLILIESHMMLNALKIAGVEELPIFKAADSILKDGRVEIHFKPIKPRYR